MPVRIAWTFYDPTVPETWVLPINPNDGGAPNHQKKITYQNSAAPDGQTLVFEGRDEPETLDWSGVLLTQEQYNAFVYWYKKRHQILITDDLGRQFWCYITKFTPKRVRARSHPWKHTYEGSATILDWPDA